MESKKNESFSKTIPTKALCNLAELIELQVKRINIVEQQFIALAARVSDIEGPNRRARSFR